VRIVIPLMLISFLFLSCEREWISNEFIKPDASNNIPDSSTYNEEPAKEDPVVIKSVDVKNSTSFSLKDRLVFDIGNSDTKIGLLEGGEDELPSGPMSFSVSEDGEVYILDTINAAIKGFDSSRGLKGFISISERARDIVDIVITPNKEIAVSDMSQQMVFLLKNTAKSLSEHFKSYKISGIEDFSGLTSTLKGNIFVRYGDQQMLKLNESGLNIPFMSLISRNEDMFFRLKKVSGSLSMLFMSSMDQNSTFKGNTEKQIELALGMPVLSMSFLDTDAKGRQYLLVEVDDGSSEVVKVKRYVIRTGAKAEDWSKPIEIPLDVYAFPFKDIVIGSDGSVYAMLVYKDRVEVARWKTE